MALTPKQAFDLTQSIAFTARLQFLLSRYAIYCLASVATGVGQAGRPGSKVLAARIQSDCGGMTSKIAVSLITDANIVAGTTSGTQGTANYDHTATDTNLDAWMQGLWNSGAWDNIV